MSTTANTPSVPPTPPVNPAKGNLRGQTTLAAEIDRWQALAKNLAPQINQMPVLQQEFTQFQALLAEALAVRNQLNTLQADLAAAFVERNQTLLDGGDLFSRLSLALQAAHGPTSPQLRAYGLKPRRRTGRPRKTVTPPTVAIAQTPSAEEKILLS
jgi:hypothetical protein